jgi:hypothetical protein
VSNVAGVARHNGSANEEHRDHQQGIVAVAGYWFCVYFDRGLQSAYQHDGIRTDNRYSVDEEGIAAPAVVG